MKSSTFKYIAHTELQLTDSSFHLQTKWLFLPYWLVSFDAVKNYSMVSSNKVRFSWIESSLSLGPIYFEEIGTLSLNPKASAGKLILKQQFYKYFLNITQPLNTYWFSPFIIHRCHWSKLVLLFSIHLVYSRFIVEHNNLLYLV